MRDEYDFGKGVRGKHAGMEIRMIGAKTAAALSVKAGASKAKKTRRPEGGEKLDEAVKLLMRVQPHLQDSQRAQKNKFSRRRR